MITDDRILTLKKFVAEFYGNAQGMSDATGLTLPTIYRNLRRPPEKGYWRAIYTLYSRYEKLKRDLENEKA